MGDIPPPMDFPAMIRWLQDARAVIAEHQAGRHGCPECDGHGHTLRLSRATLKTITTARPADEFTYFGGGIRYEVDDMVPPGKVLQVRCWTCRTREPLGLEPPRRPPPEG